MWEKLFNDLSISVDNEKTESLILIAMSLDLYKNTKSPELKKELEEFFVNSYKLVNLGGIQNN